MKTQRAPQLATSRTGTIDGSGSVTKDKYPALVANKEAILNAGAAEAFAKLMGMSINEFNAIYAPKGAETKVVDGVVHAAAGAFNPYAKKPVGIETLMGEKPPSLPVDNTANLSPDATFKNQGVLGVAGENIGKMAVNIGDALSTGHEAVKTLSSGAMEGTGKLLFGKDNKPSLDIPNISEIASHPDFNATAPSILPPTNQVSAPKPEATNEDVANMVRGIPNPVANVPEFTPTGGVRSNVVTENTATQPQSQASAAPSLMTGIDLSGKGISKAVGAGAKGTTLYSNVDQPNPSNQHNSPNNSTPQSRFAGVAPVETEAQYQSQQAPSIITPEMQLRTEQGLPVTGAVQPSNPTVAVKPSVNSQSIPTLAGKSAAPTPQTQDVAAITPQQTVAESVVQANPNASSIDIRNAENKAASQQAKNPQAQQAEVPPPSINNGRLAQQPAQRGYVAPQIQGILSPENQAALNEQVSRDLNTARRGTGNMSDALATKYANHRLDTILGKDTQDRSAAQANNNQAQDESQYQRTAKQKQSEEAWNQILQSDAINYGKQKDQQSLATGKRQLEFDAVKEAQKQANFEREQTQKENAPVDYKSINESGEQRSRTMTPKQLKSYEADYNDALRALEIHKDNPEMIAKIKEKMALRGFN